MAKTYPPGTDLTVCPKCRGYKIIPTQIRVNDGVCAMCEGDGWVSDEESAAFHRARESAQDRKHWLRLRDNGLADLYRGDPRLKDRPWRFPAERYKALLQLDCVTEGALVQACEQAIDLYRDDPRRNSRDYDWLTYLPLAKQDGLLNWLLGRPVTEEEWVYDERGLF